MINKVTLSQTLTYNIFNTDVATRWVNIVKKNINNPIKTILQNMTAKDIIICEKKTRRMCSYY